MNWKCLFGRKRNSDNRSPDEMSASDLIDFIRKTKGQRDIGILAAKLSEKLKAGFYNRQQDIEKALIAFGDAGTVTRYKMIKDTMQPDDLDILIVQLLLAKYAK